MLLFRRPLGTDPITGQVQAAPALPLQPVLHQQALSLQPQHFNKKVVAK